MKFKELDDELVASVKEGWGILSGKRDAACAHLPPDRSDARKLEDPDTRREPGADRE